MTISLDDDDDDDYTCHPYLLPSTEKFLLGFHSCYDSFYLYKGHPGAQGLRLRERPSSRAPAPLLRPGRWASGS